MGELRVAVSGSSVSFDGYAIRYGVGYDVYGGPPWGWRETVLPGAAARNVGDDVRLLVNHVGVPLARTRSGTLRLESDEVGLRVRAEGLDVANPRVQELVSAAQRGDLDQMSFAFVIDEERDFWNADFTERSIGGFEEIRDVAAVTFPASPTTSFTVGARSVGAARAAGRVVSVAEARVRQDLVAEEAAMALAAASASGARLRYVWRKPMSDVEARVRRVTR